MVDPSTNATDPTYPALHTIYANVTADGADKWAVLAPYINPEPTPGPAHNYSFLLFEQPQAQFECDTHSKRERLLRYSDSIIERDGHRQNLHCDSNWHGIDPMGIFYYFNFNWDWHEHSN
ncbi:uncharacterized protein BHQ10_009214 [Talaromyces amestolkiae]|uniref:Phosphatidylethanolamine-binding protein n=1 Tax=Talaromyces amestolkiae TaxID=1196081 RepID=A0A364LBL3_TALAM|nr:uncharacterized protein BHQ10_009214 [Talaromyces amestolkiae]RAO73202.1 hypothetical protein BHQ10_009214 [Talaromyces amestolkiae]